MTDAVVFVKFQNSIIMKYLFRLVVPQGNDIAVTDAIPIFQFENFNFFGNSLFDLAEIRTSALRLISPEC